MKIISVVVILAFGLAVFGCAGMSDTQQRTLSGGAIGAAGGAVIGAMAGNAGLGAAIGGAAGLAGGYIYDQNQKSKEAAYQQGYKAGQQNK
jgi:osmotically inducible lipoprotein OsmB